MGQNRNKQALLQRISFPLFFPTTFNGGGDAKEALGNRPHA